MRKDTRLANQGSTELLAPVEVDVEIESRPRHLPATPRRRAVLFGLGTVGVIFICVLGAVAVGFSIYGIPKQLKLIGDKMDKALATLGHLADNQEQAKQILEKAQKASEEATALNGRTEKFAAKAESALDAIQSFPLQAARKNPEYQSLKKEKLKQDRVISAQERQIAALQAQKDEAETAAQKAQADKTALENKLLLVQASSMDNPPVLTPDQKRIIWEMEQLARVENPDKDYRHGRDYAALGTLIKMKGGKSDYAVGKYQVRGINVKPWAEEAQEAMPGQWVELGLDSSYTPESFRNDWRAQEFIVQFKVTQYDKMCREKDLRAKKRVTHSDIMGCVSKKWFAGPAFKGKGTTTKDANGTTVAEYSTMATATPLKKGKK